MDLKYCELYGTLLNHPKTRQLRLLLGLKKNQEATAIVTNLWMWCIRYTPDGVLRDIDIEPAFREDGVGWEGATDTLKNALLTAQWLDLQPDGTFHLHNWKRRTTNFQDAQERIEQLKLSQRERSRRHYEKLKEKEKLREERRAQYAATRGLRKSRKEGLPTLPPDPPLTTKLDPVKYPEFEHQENEEKTPPISTETTDSTLGDKVVPNVVDNQESHAKIDANDFPNNVHTQEHSDDNIDIPQKPHVIGQKVVFSESELSTTSNVRKNNTSTLIINDIKKNLTLDVESHVSHVAKLSVAKRIKDKDGAEPKDGSRASHQSCVDLFTKLFQENTGKTYPPKQLGFIAAVVSRLHAAAGPVCNFHHHEIERRIGFWFKSSWIKVRQDWNFKVSEFERRFDDLEKGPLEQWQKKRRVTAHGEYDKPKSEFRTNDDFGTAD